ncbi:MAG TPA: hypothetical protein VEA41_07920 [Salinarimonas sp.]|nr:hypothetical protein [Salinarimonas sp.]
MKTKDLIAELQRLDPEGDIEVEGCGDIHFLTRQPGYYDGPAFVLKRDPTTEYYNVIGAEYQFKPDKIRLHMLDLRDVLLNDPECPITFDKEPSPWWPEHVAKVRAEMRKIVEDAKAERATARNPTSPPKEPTP